MKDIEARRSKIIHLKQEVSSSKEQIEVLEEEIKEISAQIETNKKELTGKRIVFTWNDFKPWTDIEAHVIMSPAHKIKLASSESNDPVVQLKWLGKICNTYNAFLPVDVLRGLQLRQYEKLIGMKDQFGNNRDEETEKSRIFMVSSRDQRLFG
jgi:hypothetical protein